MATWAERVRKGESLSAIIDAFVRDNNITNNLDINRKLSIEFLEDPSLDELSGELHAETVYWRMRYPGDPEREMEEIDKKVRDWLAAEDNG